MPNKELMSREDLQKTGEIILNTAEKAGEILRELFEKRGQFAMESKGGGLDV